MTKEQEKALIGAVREIAWAYILLHLNIYLGTLNILPDWVGYALIVFALPALAEEGRPSMLLKPLGIALAVYSAVSWCLAIFGVRVDIGIVTLLVSIVGLYFHFQLLTDLAGIAGKYGCPEERKLLTLRTVRTVIMALLSLPLPWEEFEGLVWLNVMVMLVICVWICGLLFRFSRSLREELYTEEERAVMEEEARRQRQQENGEHQKRIEDPEELRQNSKSRWD